MKEVPSDSHLLGPALDTSLSQNGCPILWPEDVVALVAWPVALMLLVSLASQKQALHTCFHCKPRELSQADELVCCESTVMTPPLLPSLLSPLPWFYVQPGNVEVSEALPPPTATWERVGVCAPPGGCCRKRPAHLGAWLEQMAGGETLHTRPRSC